LQGMRWHCPELSIVSPECPNGSLLWIATIISGICLR
jgi:hypothetical protein